MPCLFRAVQSALNLPVGVTLAILVLEFS